jgi:hypothetical protein
LTDDAGGGVSTTQGETFVMEGKWSNGETTVGLTCDSAGTAARMQVLNLPPSSSPSTSTAPQAAAAFN